MSIGLILIQTIVVTGEVPEFDKVGKPINTISAHITVTQDGETKTMENAYEDDVITYIKNVKLTLFD